MTPVPVPPLAFDDILAFVAAVVVHYEHSAPTVAAYADDLYVRLGDGAPVQVRELFALQALAVGDAWESPHYAANRVYKLLDALGMDTTGQAG